MWSEAPSEVVSLLGANRVSSPPSPGPWAPVPQGTRSNSADRATEAPPETTLLPLFRRKRSTTAENSSSGSLPEMKHGLIALDSEDPRRGRRRDFRSVQCQWKGSVYLMFYCEVQMMKFEFNSVTLTRRHYTEGMCDGCYCCSARQTHTHSQLVKGTVQSFWHRASIYKWARAA